MTLLKLFVRIPRVNQHPLEFDSLAAEHFGFLFLAPLWF